MKRLFSLLAVMLAFAVVSVSAQEKRAYSEGSVLQVTSVRVQDGQWDEYMNYLRDHYRPMMEEMKKAGVILDYGYFSVESRSPKDPNLYLTTTFPNMASFDGLEDRMDPIQRKVSGQTRDEGAKAYAERSTMREILGSELVRELKLN
jgi:hypothetical protein